MGAWIETVDNPNIFFTIRVAPHVGAWIETVNGGVAYVPAASLPMWERGLKRVN